MSDSECHPSPVAHCLWPEVLAGGTLLPLSRGKITVTEEQAWARIERLSQLSHNFMGECCLIRKGEDPLLYLERRAYLDALARGIAGLEKARVVLAVARQRVRRKREQSSPPPPEAEIDP